ncbi:MAG: sigma 54-interacting transcriptional regulator [Deltaproteobacteria bacterium]|nr:sigma 54-interacting transcriptional regulator [Deltaproteobacteria bacterium]
MTEVDQAAGEATLAQQRDRDGPEPTRALLVFSGDSARVVRLEPGHPVVLGRAAPADVVVSDATLSRSHARFWLEGDEVWVEDLGSRNGTAIGGRTVDRSRLLDDESAVLGSVRVSIHLPGPRREERSGICSHDRFMSWIEEEVIRGEELGRTLALVLLRETSPEGRVERWVPRLRAVLRRIDRVARYGPSELEVLLPETSAEAASAFAAALLEAPPASLDVRIAIATFPESGTSADELLEAARRAFDGADPAKHVFQAVGRSFEPASDDPVVLSPKMVRLFDEIDRLAKAALPVLVFGETGAGKEIAARRIHERGPRRERPFLSLNCGAIPESLLESALFGHERGAFTGATQRTAGIFEAAGSGTVFLDEVGELSPAAQVALLRVLEGQRVTRVGGADEIETSARVVAATHRDLESMVEEGSFRADLFYRLSSVTLEVPPLRERLEEIPTLTERFSIRASARNDCPRKTISGEALEALLRHSWPGNVRELRNVVERAVVISDGFVIRLRDLPERIACAIQNPTQPESKHEGTASAAMLERGFHRTVDEYEAAILSLGLADAKGNKAETSRRLRIPLRTLVNKVAAHRLESLDAQRVAELSAWLAEVGGALRRATGSTGEDLAFSERIERLERLLIQTALEQTGGNKAEASRRLSVPLKTLSNKAKAFGLRGPVDPR